MEIDFEFSPTLVYFEPIKTHNGKLCLIRGVKFDHCPAPGTISLQNWVHSWVVLCQLFKHQPTEIDRQVFDLYQIAGLDLACCSSWRPSSPCFFLWLLFSLNFLLFLFRFSSDINYSFSLLYLFLLCLIDFLVSFFDSLALSLALSRFLLLQGAFLLKKTFTALFFLCSCLLLPFFASLPGHFLQAHTFVSPCMHETLKYFLL